MKKWMKYFGVGAQSEDIIEEEVEEELEEDLSEAGQIALDILETDDEMILLAPIGGIDLGDVDLSFNQSVLTIKGKRNKPTMYYDNVEVRNQECHWGKFERSIILPENLDFDTIQASLENNLLVITIGKLEFASQNIKINKVES